jgi:hypothetical protein
MAVIDDLLAYYDMTEASGNAIDAHGALDLTDASSVGASGGYRNFVPASFDYFTAADHADLSVGDTNWSLVIWFQADAIPAFGAQVVIKYGTGSNREYTIFHNNTGNPMRVTFGYGSGADTVSVTNTTGGDPVADGTTWHMYTIFHDATNNLVGIRHNAEAADTVAHTLGVNDGAQAMDVGANVGSSAYFDGRIRYLGMWRRVLSDADATWLYNSGSGRDYAAIVAEASGFVPFPRPRGLSAGHHTRFGGLV